jgi:hypothetical protein
MKYLFTLFLTLSLLSCGNERILQLPEINHSEITEIDDISPAYIFYDEEKDSVELNRKNLISTTNWLVNVDKRLSLKLAIPQIKFIQNKKKNASHKKEGAKNYFTCNDTSRKNLGFIDFTETEYIEGSSSSYLSKTSNLEYTQSISFEKNDSIKIISSSLKSPIKNTSTKRLLTDLKELETLKGIIYLNFNKNLTFQDYITYKSILKNINLKEAKISNKEFIFN